MAVLNAWAFPGSTGDRAYFSDIGHFRTEVGNAWTMATFVYLDNLTPGEDGYIFNLRRASNNAASHQLIFDDNNNQLSYIYQGGSENDAGAMSATTWYLAASTYPGTGTTVTTRLISAAGSQIGSSSGTATSPYDDGQTQQISYGAAYNGTVTSGEVRGRLCLPLFLQGVALSQSELEAYAADPLNEGDLLLATYGGAVAAWFDDTNTDQGPNGETLTLEGAVTLGSANGPTVTDRVASGTPLSIVAVGVKSLAIIFDLELAVPYSGTEFGTDPPLVELTSDALGVSNLVEQTVRSYGDTSGTFDCDLGALTAGPRYLKITNQTVGDASYGQSVMRLIEVKADEGEGVVSVRRTIPSMSSPISVAISTFDAAGEFHVRNAQEALAYSTTGTPPAGLSHNTSTGAWTGTVDSGAAGTYNTVERCTDSNGEYAEQPIQWVIGEAEATAKLPGSWGRRSRIA